MPVALCQVLSLDERENDMAIARQMRTLLEQLARLRPELYDLIHPHVPYVAWAGSQLNDRGAAVALNPQPIPPGIVLRIAVESTARAAAEAAITASMVGRDGSDVLQEVGEDWCPTPPTPFPGWPRRWPSPWPRDGEGGLDASVVRSVQAQAGLIFQAYASGIADENLSDAFGELADRMLDAASQERG